MTHISRLLRGRNGLAIAVALPVVLLAGCGGPINSAPGQGFQPVVRAPSVYGLIGERDRLDLTSEQIEALDSIGSWFAAETAELRIEPEFVRRTAAADTVAARETRSGLQRANDELTQGVFAVLTPEQRTTACRLDGDEERRPDPRIRPPQQGEEGFMRRAWAWCSTSAPAEASPGGSAD